MAAQVLPYLFLRESLLSEEEPGHGLRGVEEEASLLQVGEAPGGLQVKLLYPVQERPGRRW